MKALLVLEDGKTFSCQSFTGHGESWGELVFNTSMTGYQEVLTDPSYCGQMVVMTYPLIGNYGVNPGDIESNRIQVAGSWSEGVSGISKQLPFYRQPGRLSQK
jgi:carbamoyl-phosphate synthase small subunit